MKTTCSIPLIFLFTASLASASDPRIDSWFTKYTAKYARIYTTTANMNSGNAVTTWSRGVTQSSPAYCGVQEVYYSTDWVYIRSTGLGSHILGPWYLDAAKTNLFPNYPVNQRAFYRIPRNPTVPTSKTLTGLGVIGYFEECDKRLFGLLDN